MTAPKSRRSGMKRGSQVSAALSLVSSGSRSWREGDGSLHRGQRSRAIQQCTVLLPPPQIFVRTRRLRFSLPPAVRSFRSVPLLRRRLSGRVPPLTRKATRRSLHLLRIYSSSVKLRAVACSASRFLLVTMMLMDIIIFVRRVLLLLLADVCK